jgi:sugar fermentation stimulation protein A
VRFAEPLIEGTLLRRYKRFFADVRLRNGQQITAHCANPGSMLSCSEPGSRVLLSVHDGSERKFKHQLEIIYAGRTPVGIHPRRPNSVVAEAITLGRLPELAGYASLRQEVPYGRASRVDLLLAGNGLRPCYVDVKNVTLADGGVAYFPDAVSDLGTRHMIQLTDMVREGKRAMVIFVAQRGDVSRFKPADHIDQEFGQALRDAVARGVEALCYRTKVTRKGIELDTKLPIELN